MKAHAFVGKLLFVVLATLSFNSFAMYVGNPNRPDTIWVPGECRHGCWAEGHYIKFMTPVHEGDLVWVSGQYDYAGNWVEGHYQLTH